MKTQAINSPQEPIESQSAEYPMDGHPDKVCDLIADAVLDEYLATDPHARVGCEVLVAKELVVVAGEVSSNHQVDIELVVRRTLADIGYLSHEVGLASDTCRVITSMSPQSPCLRSILALTEARSQLPASDQAIVVGFATKNGFGMLPPASYLAKKLAIEISCRRRARLAPELWPDGKTLVSLSPHERRGSTVQIVVSSQHKPTIQAEAVAEIIHSITAEVLRSLALKSDVLLTVNPPTGEFSFGGPAADTGLSGRKLLRIRMGPPYVAAVVRSLVRTQRRSIGVALMALGGSLNP